MHRGEVMSMGQLDGGNETTIEEESGLTKKVFYKATNSYPDTMNDPDNLSGHHSHTRSINPKFMNGIGKHTTALVNSESEGSLNHTSEDLLSSRLEEIAKSLTGDLVRPSCDSIPTLEKPRLQSRFSEEPSMSGKSSKTPNPVHGQIELSDHLSDPSSDEGEHSSKDKIVPLQRHLSRDRGVKAEARYASKKLSLFGKQTQS